MEIASFVEAMSSLAALEDRQVFTLLTAFRVPGGNPPQVPGGGAAADKPKETPATPTTPTPAPAAPAAPKGGTALFGGANGRDIKGECGKKASNVVISNKTAGPYTINVEVVNTGKCDVLVYQAPLGNPTPTDRATAEAAFGGSGSTTVPSLPASGSALFEMKAGHSVHVTCASESSDADACSYNLRITTV